MRILKNTDEHRVYLDFLRNLLKDQPYVALAYMTGILPVKQYGEHSTLNMFSEYSMTSSRTINDCFGFTESEVKDLCAHFHMDFYEIKEWYDGYHLRNTNNEEVSIYSPKSVCEAIMNKFCEGYWNKTETFEALRKYIIWDVKGLKTAILNMLANHSEPVDTQNFYNDLFNIKNKDNVLTLLIHLGYLAYDQNTKQVRIPNKEVSQEFVRSISNSPEYGNQLKQLKLQRIF